MKRWGIAALMLLAACGSNDSSSGGPKSGADGGGGSDGGVGSGGDGGVGSSGDAGTVVAGKVDLCAGLVQDLAAHPMSAVAQPAVGEVFTDPEFGTKMRRITAVANSGTDPAIVPMYSTISAWNADESLMILYSVAGGIGHQLYDGKTYQLIRALDINPADVEQVYWDTSDPDLLYYVDGQEFIRYHVKESTKDSLHNFSDICGADSVTNGDDPMFTSWDSHRLGLLCGTKMFVYDSSTDKVFGPVTASGTPPAQVSASGTLAYLEANTGDIYDVSSMSKVRTLTLQAPDNHASLGRLVNGHDTWNGAVFDDGDDGVTSNVGNLVTWDMTDGTGGAVIGPKTGYPYPKDGHISALAYKQPGWVFVSTIPDSGDTTGLAGTGLLDMENLIADTNTGKVCRVGRHRSYGKNNTHITDSYWAEPHTVPSPSGTRAAFASDWGNGMTVDTYILELPSYAP